MATLPDLDTSQVSVIGYWNAIEQGGADPDNWGPTEVTTHGSINTVTTYDNGVAGTLSLSNGGPGSFRVKQDGWMVVYIDRTLEVGQTNQNPLMGPWAIIRNVGILGGYTGNTPPTGDLVNNTLETAIGNLFNETSVSGNTNVSYTRSEVGYYNYAEPDATNMTLLSDRKLHEGDYNGDGTDGSYVLDETASFSYTDPTTVYEHLCTATGEPLVYGPDYEAGYHGRVRVGGANSSYTEIGDSADYAGVFYGARQAPNINYATDPGLAYENHCEAATYGNGLDSDVHSGVAANQLLFWA